MHGLLKKSTKDIFSPHAELYVAEMISFRSFYVIFKMSFEMESGVQFERTVELLFLFWYFEYSAYAFIMQK